MKRTIPLFCTLGLLLPLSASSQPQPGAIAPPDWSEFCPQEYLQAQHGPVRDYNRLKNGALAATLVGAFAARKNRKNHEADLERNYWADRRKQFNKEVANCQGGSKDIISCFMQVRQIELSKNSQHQQDLHQREMLREQRRQRILNSDSPNYHCDPDYVGGYNCY